MASRPHATVTRNTCFAIISAIEEDVRNYIRHESDALGLSNILPPDARDAAAARWQTDNRSNTISHPENDLELLEYTDFSDLSKTIHSTIAAHKGGLSTDAKAVARKLDSLVPTRNRVCHTRPVEADDLPKCMEASDYFTQLSGFDFSTLKHTKKRLSSDPSYVLNLYIPDYWSLETQIHHNLPLPEFDETGFLGRDKDRREVHKLLKSHYPVLTIVGEGGVGKTALALRCLYDLLDAPDAQYDAIVWVSLKTRTLTDGGIRDIEDALGSTLGLLSSVADNLGTPNATEQPASDLIVEIVEYLTEYRVLVAIDNLETISGASLRDLLVGMPAGSKLLFTSRVGLGEFETRYALPALEPGTAAALMRRFATVLGVSTLFKSSDGLLKRYCQRLFNNPLLVKWFVASVARGSDPNRLLDRSGKKFQDALAFCFASLVEGLNSDERKVVDTLASARKALSTAELYYLSGGLASEAIEWALGTLHNSSLVRRSVEKSGMFTYQLSEPATAFLSEHSPPRKEVFSEVQVRMKELRRLDEQADVARARYEYDIFTVRSGSRDERIAAVYLHRALTHLNRQEIAPARRNVAEAKGLLPTYAEVYRVSSLIEAKAGETYRAIEELDQAVQHSQESRIVRYTYAQCLIRELEDHEEALKHLRVAQRTDPGNSSLRGAVALCLTRLGRYPEAAEIYQTLIATIAEVPRRWQVTTLDQAAECYRRWAERDLLDKDLRAARDHVEMALETVRVAVERHCVDGGTPYRLGRIVTEGLTVSVHSRDDEYGDALLSSVEDLVSKLPTGHIKCREKDSQHLQARLGSGLFERYVALIGGEAQSTDAEGSVGVDSKPEPSLAREPNPGDQSRGVIRRIAAGARYGFILADNGSEWFFHYKAILSRPDWSSIHIGRRVVFEIGANEQGPCATRVQLEASTKA